MDKKDLRIVYLGTPDFAVESLRRLVENGYNESSPCQTNLSGGTRTTCAPVL